MRAGFPSPWQEQGHVRLLGKGGSSREVSEINGTAKRREKVMMFFSSTVSPDHDSARMTSSRVIMPRSPWLASLGCTKKAGVPVEAKVAAIFWPTWPLLPMPETMMRPLAALIRSTAFANGWLSPLSSAALS